MQKDFQLLILIYVTLSQPNRIFLCLLKTLNFILKIFALYVNSKIAFSDLKGFTPRGKIYKKRGIESIFSTPSFSLHFHGSTFSQGQNSTYDLFVIFSYLVVFFELIWCISWTWFWHNPLDTGRKLNVRKTFRHLIYVRFTSCVMCLGGATEKSNICF